MKVRRLGILSTALTVATLQALLGFFIALFILLMNLGLGIVFSGATGDQSALGAFLGIGAVLIIVLPIMQWVGGFIMTIILVAIYNLVAGWTGGIDLQFEQQQTYQPVPPQSVQQTPPPVAPEQQMPPQAPPQIPPAQ
ncbi:MAG: hypothetical protein ABH833_02430 [Parcubacteria group bacterium]